MMRIICLMGSYLPKLYLSLKNVTRKLHCGNCQTLKNWILHVLFTTTLGVRMGNFVVLSGLRRTDSMHCFRKVPHQVFAIMKLSFDFFKRSGTRFSCT